MVTKELGEETKVEDMSNETVIQEPVSEETAKTEVIEPVNYELKYKQQQSVLQREVEAKKALQIELEQAKALHQPLSEIMERLNAQGELLSTLQDAIQNNGPESLDANGNPIPKVSYKAKYVEQNYQEAEQKALSRINARLMQAGISGQDPRLYEAGITFTEASKAKNPILLAKAERELEWTLNALKPKETPMTTPKAKTPEINPESLKVETGSSSSVGVDSINFTGVVTNEQLSDREFWEANKVAILKAQRSGKLIIK